MITKQYLHHQKILRLRGRDRRSRISDAILWPKFKHWRYGALQMLPLAAPRSKRTPVPSAKVRENQALRRTRRAARTKSPPFQFRDVEDSDDNDEEENENTANGLEELLLLVKDLKGKSLGVEAGCFNFPSSLAISAFPS
ncbi:hypothetical protein LTR84_001636 [Exophiala bonariae]|uniref:Uncharacterized protein n=1 Tax=Exophiala bonariae TaxID=1690606 RepID=A0AAV9MRP2_9EURO|nr:hypothetical protein LTR84_001636 [Exophiala bonariae]